MERLKMAACGIDCNECGQYKVTALHDMKAAESLVGWFRSQGWIGKDDGAEAVMKRAPLCNGCWDKTGVVFCGCEDIRGCCERKGINHCGECDGFPCGNYDKWVDGLKHHEKARDLLMGMRGKLHF